MGPGMTEARFDVAVIGAGPAGSCAAIAARRAGARVLLVDRAEFPRAKACGCCLSPQAIAAIDALDVGFVLADALPLRTVRLSSRGREARFTRDAGVAIGRDVLDCRLAAAARDRGADVRLGTAARLVAPGVIELGDARERVSAAVVVAADGIAGSSLAGDGTSEWNVAPESRIGFGATVPAGAVDCAGGEIRMHVDRSGYVGAVALPDGTIDIAGAVLPEAVRAHGGPAESALRILAGAVVDPSALRAARWRGTPPLTRRRRTVAGPGLLLAGDAAGYVEPFTGEGIGWAAATGAAAGHLAAGIARGGSSERDWPAIHAAIARRSAARCRAIALLLRSPAAVQACIALGRLAPSALAGAASRIGRPAAAEGART